MIAELSSVDAEALHAAIRTTFAQRDTHPAPNVLPQPREEWATQFHRLAVEVGVPGELGAGYAEAASLLAPILSGEVMSGRWDREGRRWVLPPS